MIKIRSIIHVERPTQKGIIIGQKGDALTKLGIAAREALERFFQKQIFLALHIKVTPNWGKSRWLLKKFGYPAKKINLMDRSHYFPRDDKIRAYVG